MSITIRKATKNDIKLVQQFGFELLDYERQNWDPTLEADWPFSEAGKKAYEKAINEKYTIIAEDEKKHPVGFLIGKIVRPDKDAARKVTIAQLENIFVYPDSREKNIGKQLFEHFKSYCKTEGVNKINVTVNAKNTTAIKFYEKTNFSPSRLFLSQEI